MKKIIIAAAVASALAGCSSQPKVTMPDGGSRVPVNSDAKMAEFKTRSAEEQADRSERSALTKQVQELSAQVQGLKTYIILSDMAKASQPPKAQPVAEPLPAQPPASAQAPIIDRVGIGESIEVRNQAVIFRVTHPFAKTDFKPSDVFQAELLQAAQSGKRIEIRGRTDAEFDNTVDRDIAMWRAWKARRFLIVNGIAPSKIRMSFLASGGYIANNATADGKALNRRVEVETMDLDTTAFQAQRSVVTTGSL